MFCTQCGHNNSTNARFCYNCGIQIPHTEAKVAEPHATEPRFIAEPPKIQKTNFIIKQWRGEYSLGISYWIFGFLVTIFVILISAFIGMAEGYVELGTKAYGFFIVGAFLLLYVVTAWQLVGIWRASDKHTKRGGKLFWANFAKVIVVMYFLRICSDLTINQYPFISEGFKMAFGTDDVPPYSIRIIRDGTELELAGGMPFGTTKAINNYLNSSPSVRVIHLNSQGGRMVEAYKLYKLIKEKNLITYTSKDCVSACSIAFLAGREKYIGEKGRLGFHSTSVDGQSGAFINALNNDVRLTLENNHVPESFIDRALSTAPSSMWYPSNDELLNAHVIDSVVDSRYFGLSGITQWRDTYKLEATILSVPFFAMLAQYDESNYSKLRNIMVTGIQDGRALIDIQKDIRSIFLNTIIPAYLTKAPDEDLVSYWKIQIDEMRYLSKLNPQYCADMIFPRFASSNLDLIALLTKELQSSDIAALTAIVKGVGINPQSHVLSKQVRIDLDSTLGLLKKNNPWAIPVINNPTLFKGNSDLLCAGMITFYSEVMALPINRSGPVLRYLASE